VPFLEGLICSLVTMRLFIPLFRLEVAGRRFLTRRVHARNVKNFKTRLLLTRGEVGIVQI
jgi:hypothetical protein